MTTRARYKLYAAIVLTIFTLFGFVVMIEARSVLDLKGVLLGAGYGAIFAFGYLIGRSVYGEDKSIKRLMFFLVLFIVGLLAYQLLLQRPWFDAHYRTGGAVGPELFGAIWAFCAVGALLGYIEWRQEAGR